MNKTLLVSSLICVALLVYAPIDTFLLREYHDHQRAYREALSNVAKNEKETQEAKRYEVKIRQLVLPELQRIDRCVSCHVSLEDPRMDKQPLPLQTHPGNYLEVHDVGKIGCTVCHDGQGRALTAEDAHANRIEGWEKPMLHAPYIQANCMRCHEAENLPGMELVRKGYDLLHAKGCLGCHKIEGKGGQLATDLTYIGDASPSLKHVIDRSYLARNSGLRENKNLAYILESIQVPDAQPPVTPMMDFKFTDDEALALTIYLKGLTKRGIPASYVAKRQQQSRVETFKGEGLYDKYCVACHGERGVGGVENRNYARGTIPALNKLAGWMGLEYEEDAEYIADLLNDGEDIVNMSPPLDIDGRARILAQYKAINNVIRNGNPAGKDDPEGPDPLIHMPSWAEGLSDGDIDGILAYLLLQYPWDD
ncbi:MAG: cytochrome c [Candidatus Hydrogenedentes bacterium]|nr:cytochrome c [Candidatus Hydrogenedentota bacterium]